MKAYIAVPVTLGMIYRAFKHNSLTPAGIIAATFTAVAHAVHPWSLPFSLLIVFFLAGTRVTKIKHDIKAKLTIQASGSSGGEGPRTHVQVFANSGVASTLALLHTYQLRQRERNLSSTQLQCYPWPGDLLMVGIIANYAAVAADTFSSELGILSKSQPRLITSWNLRKVPPGTNGGVTLGGLAAGLLGSFIVVITSMVLTPFCSPMALKSGSIDARGWTFQYRGLFALTMTLWGALGSLLDSFLGGWFQQSVVDTRTGRIVEGDGGKKVLVSTSGPNSLHYKKRAEVRARLLKEEGRDSIPSRPGPRNDHIEANLDKLMGASMENDSRTDSESISAANEKASRVIESGSLGILDNNEVNFLMALTMSLGAMGVAGVFWDLPLASIFAI